MYTWLLLWLTALAKAGRVPKQSTCNGNAGAVFPGGWNQHAQWQPSCGGSPVGNFVGLQALEVLSSAHVIFLGDSILRQVYNTLVQGTIRGLPVLVDPVYGFASYKAALYPDGGNSSDAFTAVGKLENRGRSFAEAPSPPGWNPRTGVDASYSFAQDCKEQVAVLQRLKASKRMFRTTSTTPTPQQQQRRVVLVLGVGATTALGDMSNVACLRNLLPASISSLALRWSRSHGVAGSHRVIVLNQPMNSTRLRGVAPEKQAAVTDAVKAFVASVNGQSTNGQISNSDRQSETKSANDNNSSRRTKAHAGLEVPPLTRVTASVVDFARVVSESALDPGAPPDAALPVLEDDLHFGCMFGSVGKGRMAKPWGAVNTVGYQPSFVRGLHLVRSRNQSSATTERAFTSGSVSIEARTHCALACNGALLRALSGMVLEAAKADSAASEFDEKQSSLLSDIRGRSGSTNITKRQQQSVYQTDECVPEYAQVPCPLYPPPDSDATTWEYPSASKLDSVSHHGQSTSGFMRSKVDHATLVAQTARQATLSDKLRADLAEAAARTKLPFQPSGNSNTTAMFASWETAFATGGGNGCRSVKEYARFVGKDWCEAALSAPGGPVAATTASHTKLKGPRPKSNSMPSGWWCALPQRGHWSNSADRSV